MMIDSYNNRITKNSWILISNKCQLTCLIKPRGKRLKIDPLDVFICISLYVMKYLVISWWFS